MNIKKLRKQKGWTQSDLADKLGLTRGTIHLMENGKRDIDKRTELALKQLMA